ncbi:uncharacterized protein HRG_10281 [Hirsutella rhossiliensis]|uniref:Uncharacterized protein n=1 Tax=Hirsutella rhossiliensis TaxID=111463 RepID=A0A9P8SE48_9HYPO|nr:uncharacterized protein HRG_10281 [Hirsutella rhossiliensis]KAH0958594.1 hypothetical protein HRG_10281 [Hirsutella rhossiliensis]
MVSKAVGIALIILGLCAGLGGLFYLGKGQVQNFAQQLFDHKTRQRQHQQQPDPDPDPEAGAAPSEAATAGA